MHPTDKDLLHAARELAGASTHHSGSVRDVIHGDFSVGLNDEGSNDGHNSDSYQVPPLPACSLKISTYLSFKSFVIH